MTIFRNLNKKKKRLKPNRDDNNLSKPNSITDDFFNGDEKEVAKILKQLHRLMFKSSQTFLLSWGCKRKRSQINRSSSRSLDDHTTCPTPPKPPFLLPCSSCVEAPPSRNSKKTFIPVNHDDCFSTTKDSILMQKCCKRKASKKKKKKKTNLELEKEEECVTNSCGKQENLKMNRNQSCLMVMDDYKDEKVMKKKLKMQARPSISKQQREENVFCSNSSSTTRQRRRSFNVSSSLAGFISFSVSKGEKEEEGSLTTVASQQQQQQHECSSSLTSILQGGFGCPYDQETISSSLKVGSGAVVVVCIPVESQLGS